MRIIKIQQCLLLYLLLEYGQHIVAEVEIQLDGVLHQLLQLQKLITQEVHIVSVVIPRYMLYTKNIQQSI